MRLQRAAKASIWSADSEAQMLWSACRVLTGQLEAVHTRVAVCVRAISQSQKKSRTLFWRAFFGTTTVCEDFILWGHQASKPVKIFAWHSASDGQLRKWINLIASFWPGSCRWEMNFLWTQRVRRFSLKKPLIFRHPQSIRNTILGIA